MAHISPCAVVVCKDCLLCAAPIRQKNRCCGTWLSPGVDALLKQTGREGPSKWNSCLTDLMSRSSAEKSSKALFFQCYLHSLKKKCSEEEKWLKMFDHFLWITSPRLVQRVTVAQVM